MASANELSLESLEDLLKDIPIEQLESLIASPELDIGIVDTPEIVSGAVELSYESEEESAPQVFEITPEENVTPETRNSESSEDDLPLCNGYAEHNDDGPHMGLEPEMFINNVKITSVTPNGIFWIQAQTIEMQRLLRMEPLYDLKEICMKDFIEKVKQDRADGEARFVIKEDQEYRRINVLGKINQPRSQLLDIFPLTSERSREQAGSREQYILVDYLDYGYRKLVPLSKLIPSSYFDRVYNTYAPQSLQMALDYEEGPGKMLLSQEAMNKLLTANVVIEVVDPNFQHYDELVPVVIVHFLRDQLPNFACTPATCNSRRRFSATPPRHHYIGFLERESYGTHKTELREQKMCIEADAEPIINY